MTRRQPLSDPDVPALTRRLRRPRTPTITPAMMRRVAGFMIVAAGIAAATIHSARDSARGPVISMAFAQPVARIQPSAESEKRTVADASIGRRTARH